jgi:four helix bundle protein
VRILPRFRQRRSKSFDTSCGCDLGYGHCVASRIIAERAFEFACRIVKLCETLWTRGLAARKIADQLFDCGTSIGANAEEAEGAQTKPDFIAKLAIARKESRETVFWLQLAVRAGVATREEISWELDEAKQLRAMITQAVKTAQASQSRDSVNHQP